MATTQGLELYRRLPTNQGLHYMGSKKHPTAWCMYSHEARIALLAGADGGLWVQVTHPLIMHCYIGTEDDLKMHYMFNIEGAPQLEVCIVIRHALLC